MSCDGQMYAVNLPQTYTVIPTHSVSLLPFLCASGHFEGERIGTPFPLLKLPWNAWERRSPC